MIVPYSQGSLRLTLGADKAYDVHEFVEPRRSTLARRCKRTEEPFAAGKAASAIRRPRRPASGPRLAAASRD
jgi:hypothetical protein